MPWEPADGQEWPPLAADIHGDECEHWQGLLQLGSLIWPYWTSFVIITATKAAKLYVLYCETSSAYQMQYTVALEPRTALGPDISGSCRQCSVWNKPWSSQGSHLSSGYQRQPRHPQYTFLSGVSLRSLYEKENKHGAIILRRELWQYLSLVAMCDVQG